jgi:hypothetical protein
MWAKLMQFARAWAGSTLRFQAEMDFAQLGLQAAYEKVMAKKAKG